MEHKFGGKLGPTMNEGRTETKSSPFLLQKSQAAFSANTFDKGYQIFPTLKVHLKNKSASWFLLLFIYFT